MYQCSDCGSQNPQHICPKHQTFKVKEPGVVVTPRSVEALAEENRQLLLQIGELQAQVKKEHSDYLQEHHAHYSVELLRTEAEKKLADTMAIHSLVRGERDRLEAELKESNRLLGEAQAELKRWHESYGHGSDVPCNICAPEKRNDDVQVYPLEKCPKCGREHKLAGVACPCRFA